jgi:hypothetical protein
VFLGIDRAIFINLFPRAEKFNPGDFFEQMLGPLSEILRSARTACSRRMTMYFGNATAHWSAITENSLQIG